MISVVSIVALLLVLATSTNAFTAPVQRTFVNRAATAAVFMSTETEEEIEEEVTFFTPKPQPTSRGVSVDQDGQSNVWAIEPKMEVSNKSSDEVFQTGIVAVGGLAVFAVVAIVALNSLPDYNQF